ncbi:MAG: glycosyltransferase [Terriglobia bacterium]
MRGSASGATNMNGDTSVIIPARNEELNIEGAVRSVAAQKGVREIIVVDDQSGDGTPEILAAMAAQCPKLRVLRLRSLPAGWLGKTHAAAEGAKMATGEWLLFTDADTRHFPGSLAALLDRARSEGAGLLSISPGQEICTWWEKAVIPLVYVQLAGLFRFEDVNDPRSPAAAANGQYMLIRRSVYDSAGGWEAVRDSILDDVALARRVKNAGGKILFLPGAEWAQTRMYHRFGDMWRGWTKNLFLLYGQDWAKIAATVLRLLVLDCLPYALLAILVAVSFALLSTGAKAWITAAVAVACALAVYTGHRRYRRQLVRLGFSGRAAKHLPAGALFLSLILLNSLWAWRQGGGIEWKGRIYPAKGAL